jgi:hypothetical protein
MEGTDSGLRELVRRFRVTWETRPEMAPRGRSVAPIGYLVELTAVPERTEGAELTACSECEAALARVIDAVAPSEVLHVDRGGKQLGSAHDGRPEVTATVTVLHRDGGGANRPPDADEQARLAGILHRLRELGAQQGHWHDDRRGAPS